MSWAQSTSMPSSSWLLGNRLLPIFVLITLFGQISQAYQSDIELNTLHLNRLFIKTFDERVANLSMKLTPGAHNHELPRPNADAFKSTSSSAFGSSNNLASSSGIVVKTNIPALMNSFHQSTRQSVVLNNMASTGIAMVSNILSNPKYMNSSESVYQELTHFKIPKKFCPFQQTITCDTYYPYRSLDGTCNNLKHLWLGQTETPYKRWLLPDYSDMYRLNEPRTALDGSELPSARDLSCLVNSEESYEIEPYVTHLYMQWGQFISHDVTSLSISRDEDGSNAQCSKCERTEKCFPIPLRGITNGCHSHMEHDCIEFTRSSAAFSDIECSLGRREQLNLQTSYIDGSQIYGTDLETAAKLRVKNNDVSSRGLMAYQQNGFNSDLLPADQTPRPSDCLDYSETRRCFRAGDDRVNQNPGLIVFHTIFLREHNRIARILGRINPVWTDEQVYQETRRIVIAILQHITYNEYLPILLGERTMKGFQLLPTSDFNYFTGYDPNVDPRVSNEFAAAAGRYGHSMIRTEYSRLDRNYEKAGATSFMLRNSYFRANHIYDECQGGLESILRGFLRDPLMKIDRGISSGLTNHLFETHDDLGRPFHFDLAAINIQRGRDHGVPGYTKWRLFCGLPPINNWDDMKLFIQPDAFKLFKQLYKYVEDVDLYVAGLSEIKEPGVLIGPTFACLVARQFRDLKFGDRFWYETNVRPGAFEPGQLAEIKKTSLAKVLCRNMLDTPFIQPLAFLSTKLENNKLVDCDSFSDIDWSYWRN